ncbi:hypothetical protein [Flavobacterium acetivorans]|uniref:hypothetical protein n=1 Tax=Flavobacterium acetivorans TaxID=2893883 RepID=UPI001E48AC3E|nr:hypothetical protein [Flavobacterium sp. F-29]UFH36347.1 hypothetical protein LNP19_04710 [Flavobacterium sp. F-29]
MRKIDYYLITSILLVIWIDYIPYKLSSFVENPDKFEIVISNLSLAYIAGCIFYYRNTYLPEKRNSKRIKRIINNDVVFIIGKRKKLSSLKNLNVDEKFEISLNGENVFIGEFLKKLQIDLHNNLDSILVIKERLPPELLKWVLLLKKHPYFKSNFTNLEELDRYIDSYILLSTKMHNEFEKL